MSLKPLSTDHRWNPRYANYARANGRTPEEQRQHDPEEWPGGRNIGFVLWHKERLREAYRQIPKAFYMGHILDHDAYDAWLTAWVDSILIQKDPP